MRVFEGKKYCLILDNVGLYRLFGLPSDDRDWQAMFEGRVAGKGVLNEEVDGLYNITYSISNEKERIISDARTELITVMTHCMKPRESSTWFDMFYDGKNPPIVERRTMRYME